MDSIASGRVQSLHDCIHDLIGNKLKNESNWFKASEIVREIELLRKELMKIATCDTFNHRFDAFKQDWDGMHKSFAMQTEFVKAKEELYRDFETLKKNLDILYNATKDCVFIVQIRKAALSASQKMASLFSDIDLSPWERDLREQLKQKQVDEAKQEIKDLRKRLQNEQSFERQRELECVITDLRQRIITMKGGSPQEYYQDLTEALIPFEELRKNPWRWSFDYEGPRLFDLYFERAEKDWKKELARMEKEEEFARMQKEEEFAKMQNEAETKQGAKLLKQRSAATTKMLGENVRCQIADMQKNTACKMELLEEKFNLEERSKEGEKDVQRNQSFVLVSLNSLPVTTLKRRNDLSKAQKKKGKRSAEALTKEEKTQAQKEKEDLHKDHRKTCKSNGCTVSPKRRDGTSTLSRTGPKNTLSIDSDSDSGSNSERDNAEAQHSLVSLLSSRDIRKLEGDLRNAIARVKKLTFNSEEEAFIFAFNYVFNVNAILATYWPELEKRLQNAIDRFNQNKAAEESFNKERRALLKQLKTSVTLLLHARSRKWSSC